MLHQITTNAKAGKPRKATLEGRDYLVVPMVMITEGVHAGSNGPILYKEEDLAPTTNLWDHKPIVVYHPTMNGVGVSACSPEVLESHKVGIVLNTRWDKRHKKLRAEAWIETGKADKVDARVLDFVNNNRVMEVSTGLFLDPEGPAGVWNGEPYSAVAKNHKPDHLALLPDQVGACSVAKGAGLLQLNTKTELDRYKSVFAVLAKSGLSHSDVRELLRAKLRGELGSDFYIEDVYDKFFIYSASPDWKLYRLGYKKSKDGVELSADPEEVIRTVEYRTVADGSLVGNASGDIIHFEELALMDKKQKVDALIGNASTPWGEDDRDYLMAIPDDKFDKRFGELLNKPAVTGNATAATTNTNPTVTIVHQVPTPAPAPVANATPTPAPAPVTFADLVANADAATKEMLGEMGTAFAEVKSGLIKTITGNTANVFTPEQLQAMPLAQLKGLAALAGAGKPAVANPLGAFLGAAAPVANANPVKVTPLVAPELTFEEKK